MIRLYHVKDIYIDYLRIFDKKVLMNKSEKRPYVGIIYSINSINYYLPLSSPKPKFQNMKNSKDFHKIAGGNYGAINFNKMIPVGIEELIEIDISNEPDIKYRNLLQNQFRELINMKNIISKKTQEIYSLFITTNAALSSNDKKIKNRCCDFYCLNRK